MTPETALFLAAGAALLLVGGVIVIQRRESFSYATQDADNAPAWSDQLTAALSAARDVVMPSPVADMAPSDRLRDMLKTGERLALQRYRLGDGGWTIGYGRFYRDPAEPPESITREQAEAWFAEDVEARAARWVRAFVSVPLLQHQFDSLCHMAYNLSPKAFKTIAEAVNAGQDPEAAALQFVRAGSNLEKGLRNRRGREIALYRSGTYSA